MDIPLSDRKASHEVAIILGGRAERGAAQFVRAVEDISLRLVEEAASYFPENPMLSVVDQSMVQVQRGGRRLPQVVGWLAERATYFSLRALLETAAILESVADDPAPLPEPR